MARPRRPPKSMIETYGYSRAAVLMAEREAKRAARERTPVSGTMRPRAYIAPAAPPPPPRRPIKTKAAPFIGLDKLGPPSRDPKTGKLRRIGGGALFSNREILALNRMLLLPKKQQTKILGKEGQKQLAKYGEARKEERRARLEAMFPEDTGVAGKLMDLFPGSRLFGGRKPLGVSLAGRAVNVPRALQVLGEQAIPDLLTYFNTLDERNKQRSRIARAGLPLPLQDIGEAVGKVALGIPAGIEGALRSPGSAKRDVSNQAASLVQLPGLLYGMVDPRAGDLQRAALIKQGYEESKRSLLAQYGPDVGWRESYRRSQEMPVTSALTGVGLVAAGARIPGIARGLAQGMTLRQAYRATTRPYLLGDERILRLRGGPGGRAIEVPIEYARSPLFRPIQRGYDAVSRRLPVTTRGVRHFAEPQRAARAKRRLRQREIRRDMAKADSLYRDIAKLSGAEEARLIFSRDKPEGVPDEVWFGAMIEDMQDMLAGREIIRPDKPDPPSVVRAKKRLAYFQKRFDVAVERRGTAILGEKMAPLVTQSRSLREQIRYRRRQGQDTSDLEQQLYDVNARLELARGEKVRPVKDSPEREQFARALSEQLGEERVGPLMQVTDSLARAAEPDNPAKWYRTRLSETTVGTEEEAARLVAQGSGLWQRPGYAWNLVRHDSEPQPGDLVWGDPDEPPFIVEGVDGDVLRVRGVTDTYPKGWVLRRDEVTRTLGLPHGRRVVAYNGESGTITDARFGEDLTKVVVRSDNGYDMEMHVADLVPEHAPVFYSHAQRVIEEKAQKKSTPQQIKKLLEKEGVKTDELEWSGINDWIEVLEESGVKTVEKDEVLRYLSDPLNAFDMAEVLFEDDVSGYHNFGTRWRSHGNGGLIIRDDEGYRELVMTLPKEQMFSHGHWSGVSNPLVHVRFHETTRPDGKRVLLIDELQSDWHQAIQKRGARPRDAETQIMAIKTEINALHDKMNELAAKFGVDGFDKLHDLWTRAMHDVQRYVEETPGTNITDASAPIRDLTRGYRLMERYHERLRALRASQGDLERGTVAAPFQKNRWLDLAMKRMVAYAAREGFDRIDWVEGNVQAVRYELVNGGIGDDYDGDADPSSHPDYPDQENYTWNRTYASYDLEEGIPESGSLQERLFGPALLQHAETGRREVVETTWREGVTPQGVPIEQATPLRIPIPEDDEHVVGDMFTTEDGVLVKIIGREDDDFLVQQTGITRIEIRSNKQGDWGDQDAIVEISDAKGNSEEIEVYGGTSAYLEDLLNQNDELAWIINQDWFGDLDKEFDRNWESELDEYEYQSAVDHFMEYEWEPPAPEHDFDSLADLGPDDFTDSGKGVARFYDEVLPNTVSKLFKADDITVGRGQTIGRYSTESKGPVTEHGPIGTWGFDIPPGLKQKAIEGQRLFQAAHHGKIKGAVEFLQGDRMALRLFESADVSTVIHELGHVSLYDMDHEDILTVDRDLASGRSFLAGEWLEQDHERFARAWERYFIDGKADRTALRGVFDKLMTWMRMIYPQAKALGARISPEVEAVFNRRLGREVVSEQDIVRYAGRFDPQVAHWGAVLSQAKTELQGLESRLNAMREQGTDTILRQELSNLQEQRKASIDEDTFQDISERITAIEDELEEHELDRVSRARRREKLLSYQLHGLEQALKLPKDDERFAAAVHAANYLQSDREGILREILGPAYDEVFEGRRRQMSTWLHERGYLAEADVGEGVGYLPFQRTPPLGRSVRTGTSPRTQKYGKASTRELNLHKRNEMMLWQLGDFTADPKVLLESWARASAFKWQSELRQLFWEIGEDVPRDGPTKDYYLINLEGRPLPKHWESGLNETEIAKILDDLEGGSDEGLMNRLHLFAKNWISNEPSDFRAEDGSYPGVRMVHKSIVHSMLLPYQAGTAIKGVLTLGEAVNSLARLSLIYANPGYIPSNVFANSILGIANSGPWFIRDAAVASKWMVEDKKLARFVQAEMGDASLSAMLPENLGRIGRGEKRVAEFEQVFADNWARIAGWIGTARRNGYRGKEDLIRLLESKDPKVMRDKDFISREATNAMIDFDRLSPIEKRYIQPWLFVWPFLRGAMAWPVSYAMNFPERTAAAVALTAGQGEEQREKLGPVPPYYEALVPQEVDKKEGVGLVSNLASVSPLGPFADAVKVAYGLGAGIVSDEKQDAFNNLFGYVAPQYQGAILAMQGRSEFGGEQGLRTIGSKHFIDLIPGMPILTDILDESKPSIYMEQDLWRTLYRRTFRFSPQQVNINVLNERAQARKAKTPEQKTNALVKKARAVWSKGHPTDPLPRSVEQSIRAFYAYSEAAAKKKDAIKEAGDWRPKRGEHTPKLTPLQDATLAYDILNAYFPAVIRSEQLPDPEALMREQGEDAVEEYARVMKRNMFALKLKAQEVIRNQEKRAEAEAA